MLRFWLPVVAVPVAVSVSVSVLPVVLGAAKVPDKPFAAPVSDRLTAPAKPPVRVIVTTAVADWPCVTDTDVGLTDRVNAPPPPDVAVTVSASVADVAVTPLPVAVTVMLAFPVVAVAVATNVSVAELAADAIVVEDTVTPVGRPVTAIATSPVNPPERVRFTVTLPAVP